MNALVPTTRTDATEALPCFQGLTPMQSAFVRCYVQNGDGNATQAARNAGYSETSAHAVGYRLLRKDEVLQAIGIETRASLNAIAPLAVKRMQHLALKARSEFVQQTAAADILDRAGFKPPDRHQHVVGGGLVIDIKLTDGGG
jgi:phage terminase small subunit